MELLWNDDPEELLLELGFGCDEPDLSGRIPARFINYPSHARGINLQVFLEAQRSRIDLENPSVSNRFRQLEVLQEVSVAFSSLAATIKGPKDMSPEARERRRKMAMLFRRASKKSLSQLNSPAPQELTVATAVNPSAVIPKPLEPMYGPEERKVPFRRVKLQDTVSLSPFVEEEGEETEAEVQDGTNTSAAQTPEGEPRVGTLRERFLDRVLQRKKSLQMRESFEMEELGSFDESSAVGLESAGTHFARGLIRVNSCQSDSSGFLEDPLIPTLPQDATPATDLLKALSALSGGSTDSHSSDIPPLSSVCSPNAVDHTTEQFTGTSSNHLHIPTATSDCGVSSQSREQSPQENSVLSPCNDLASPAKLAPEQKETRENSITTDKNNLQSGSKMEEKTEYFGSSQNIDISSKTFHSTDFDNFPNPRLQKSVSTKDVYHSSVKKKPIAVTHFLSRQDSVEDLNTNNIDEETLQYNQNFKEVDSVVSNPNSSRLPLDDAYLETEIDWQDVTEHFEDSQSEDFPKGQNATEDVPVFTNFFSRQDLVENLHTNDEETLQDQKDIKEKQSAVRYQDRSRLQSDDCYLETEIDWQDGTHGFEHSQSHHFPKDSEENQNTTEETLQHIQKVMAKKPITNLDGSRLQSDGAYLETEIDWQDSTQDFEDSQRKDKVQNATENKKISQHNQDVKEKERAPVGSRLQSESVCLETEIEWQDVTEDFEGSQSEDFPKDSVKDLKTNVETVQHDKDVNEVERVVSNLDESTLESKEAYLETEIDWQDAPQDFENRQSGDFPQRQNRNNPVVSHFLNHQDSVEDLSTNKEILKLNKAVDKVENVVNNPERSRLPSDDAYLETEIDWQDVTQDFEGSHSKDSPKRRNTGSEKLVPKVSGLIEIESLDDVFETSVDASDTDAGDVEAFFEEMHSIGRVYWAEPIHIGDLSPQSDSFEGLDGFREDYEMESDEDILSKSRGILANERSFNNSTDFHNYNIQNKSSVSLTSLEDKPSKHSISVQRFCNSSSHIIDRKDVPYMDNPKHNALPRHFKLDTSNPFRAVQSWTNLHIQYNSNIMARKVSNSVGGNLNTPAESYWSPYPEKTHEWQSDDCLHRSTREEGFPSVSMDTGLWADDEDEEVDRMMGQFRQYGKTCYNCDRTCNCCKLDNQHMLSQRELEGLLLYLQQFRSVLNIMEEQLTEEQAAVYSALTQHDRQCLEELLQLRQAVQKEALELEQQLSDLVHHQDHSLTTNMLRLLDEQSLLCTQLRLFSPSLLSPMLTSQSELTNKRTVATQCSHQQGSPPNDPLQAPSPPQLHTASSHQGLGCAPAKTDKKHLVGFLHRLRDSMRH